MPTLCGVCHQSEFKYTCPRCEVLYCSLSCYQRHGSKCTESFYQQQVQEELQSQQASADERKRLEQIVSQLNRLDADDDLEDGADGDAVDDVEAAEEMRLQALAAKAENGELVIEDLTEEEARSFCSELKRGSLGRFLSPWEPWWRRAGVVEVSSQPAPEGYSDDAASPSRPPPHICCAEGREPHNSVAFTALAALYAYVHTLRAFNGEWRWAPMEAAPQLVRLCPAICSHQVHASSDECLRACLDAAAALPGRGFGTEFDLLCLTDVSALIGGGPDFSARALCEAGALLEACLAGGGRGRSGRLRRGVKKLEFLTSFVFHHYDRLQPLAASADHIAQRREQASREVREAKNIRDHDGIAIPDEVTGGL